MANYYDNTVTKLRASDGVVLGVYSVGFSDSGPVDVLFDGTSIWVANSNSGSLEKLEPRDGTVLGRVKVGFSPSVLAFDGTKVWVTNTWPIP